MFVPTPLDVSYALKKIRDESRNGGPTNLKRSLISALHVNRRLLKYESLTELELLDAAQIT